MLQLLMIMKVMVIFINLTSWNWSIIIYFSESLSLMDDSDDDKTYQPFQDLVDTLSSYESKDVSDFINDVNPIELTESQNQVFKIKNKPDHVIEERRHISGLQSNENLLSQKDFKGIVFKF